MQHYLLEMCFNAIFYREYLCVEWVCCFLLIGEPLSLTHTHTHTHRVLTPWTQLVWIPRDPSQTAQVIVVCWTLEKKSIVMLLRRFLWPENPKLKQLDQLPLFLFLFSSVNLHILILNTLLPHNLPHTAALSLSLLSLSFCLSHPLPCLSSLLLQFFRSFSSPLLRFSFSPEIQYQKTLVSLSVWVSVRKHRLLKMILLRR